MQCNPRIAQCCAVLLMVIFKLHIRVFRGEAAAPGPPAQADGRVAGGGAGGCILDCISFFCFWDLLFVGFCLRELSHLFKHKISGRMHSKSCLGTSRGLSYEHIWKNMYFWWDRFGWQAWLNRAFKTISDGGLKVNKSLGSLDIIEILWYHDIMMLW